MTIDEARSKKEELEKELDEGKKALDSKLACAGKNGNPPFSLMEFWSCHRRDSEILREIFNCIKIIEGDIES